MAVWRDLTQSPDWNKKHGEKNNSPSEWICSLQRPVLIHRTHRIHAQNNLNYMLLIAISLVHQAIYNIQHIVLPRRFTTAIDNNRSLQYPPTHVNFLTLTFHKVAQQRFWGVVRYLMTTLLHISWRLCQWYFSFKIHFRFSFYKFFSNYFRFRNRFRYWNFTGLCQWQPQHYFTLRRY